LVYPNTIGKNVKSPVAKKQQRMECNTLVLLVVHLLVHFL
jgi:hypothetical protein